MRKKSWNKIYNVFLILHGIVLLAMFFDNHSKWMSIDVSRDVCEYTSCYVRIYEFPFFQNVKIYVNDENEAQRIKEDVKNFLEDVEDNYYDFNIYTYDVYSATTRVKTE